MTVLPIDRVRPDLAGPRHWGDRAFRAVTLVSGVLVLVILALIAWTTTNKAWPALRSMGIGFVLDDDWAPSQNRFGALSLVYGTLVSSSIALVLAVPVSFGIALFITELAPRRIRRAATTLVDLLASIPSVVYGLWGVLALAKPLGDGYQRIADVTQGVPVVRSVFGGTAQGRSIMTAGVILAVMITPIVTSLGRDALATVPASDRAGALALGATRWEALRVAVLPRVRGGLVAAVMLGLGRAMGETIAVALVMGSSPQVTSRLFAPGASLAGTIANNFGEASGLHRAALIGLGVVLFALTLLVNGAARLLLHRADRRLLR